MIEKYVETKCDRCSRVIDVFIDDSITGDEIGKENKEGLFYANFDGCVLIYAHLCDSCKKMIGTLFDAMEPIRKCRTAKRSNKED